MRVVLSTMNHNRISDKDLYDGSRQSYSDLCVPSASGLWVGTDSKATAQALINVNFMAENPLGCDQTHGVATGKDPCRTRHRITPM
jgi:hypothetical protein